MRARLGGRPRRASVILAQNRGHRHMFSFTRRRASWLAICCMSLALVAGCHTKREDLSKASPEVLYQRGSKQLKSYDFGGAIRTYEALAARFPFTDQARQARLDL